MRGIAPATGRTVVTATRASSAGGRSAVLAASVTVSRVRYTTPPTADRAIRADAASHHFHEPEPAGLATTHLAAGDGETEPPRKGRAGRGRHGVARRNR